MNIVMKIGAMNVMQQEVTTTRDVPMRGRKEIIDIHPVREEAIALTGDDSFYTGSDGLEEDDLEDELEMAGLDIEELADMDEDERREALEDAGLDSDGYDDF